MTVCELPNVSRETNERLKVYVDLVAKWNPRINLVSRNSMADLWARHVVDSAQLCALTAGKIGKWVDLGSGGGFPGVVVAIMLSETQPNTSVTLVESDQRKCAFLRTALRETGCTAEVISERIELAKPLQADVLSARALADLDTLLSFTSRHLKPDGLGLFPKGESWREELEQAQSKWRFDLEVAKSETDPEAAILKVSGVSRD